MDVDYTNQPSFLAPYRGENYHRSGFQGQTRYCGPRESFNHKHSSISNIVARSFGTLKSRFALLSQGMLPYKITRQYNILFACCFIDKFIHKTIFMINTSEILKMKRTHL